MLVVMILSVRLVSCQTHRIHSGLLLMLTPMFLYFTRKEGNGSVLALLNTSTLCETESQQTQLDGCILNTRTFKSSHAKHLQMSFIDDALIVDVLARSRIIDLSD